MATTNTGGRLAELLHAEGIDTIFSIPDPSYAAVHKRALELGMRVVGARHESAGVHMADALSRVTGRPQVVMAGMGPGVANMLPGVVCASIENIPVVVIATQRGRRALTAERLGRFQFTPQIRFFEPAVKYAALVDGPHRIDEVVHQAFRQATTGRPGPVYVEIPGDVMDETIDFADLERPERYRLGPQPAPPEAVAEAAELLRAAKLPIILAGTGIHTARVHAEFRALAEALQCPVVTSPGGRGVLPSTHPQLLNFLGSGADACQAADCILTVGTAVGEPLRFGGPPLFGAPGTQRWIIVERDPAVFGVNRSFDLAVAGDLRIVLGQLAAAAAERGRFTAPPQLVEWRQQYAAHRRSLISAAPDTEPMHPGRALAEAREAVPDDAVLVLDGGSTGLFETFYGEQRSTEFLWTSKFGHLGTGLPYALGAQLGCGRDRCVCLITGDSALGFNLTELDTAVRHNLPVLILVNYDQHWGMEAMAQELLIGQQVECQHAPTRLDEIARAFGAHGEYVTRTADIRPAIGRALAARKPALVQLVTDWRVNAYEMPEMMKFLAFYEGNY